MLIDLVKKAKGGYLTVLKKFANPKIDGTQIPTNRPSSLYPINHNVTENKKLINAKIIG
jgi:hypothetical protein